VDIPFEADGDLLRFRPCGCIFSVQHGTLGDCLIQIQFERCGSEDRKWETIFRDHMNTINAFLDAANDTVNGSNEKVIESTSKQVHQINYRKNL
jgi:hypothetical protein